MFTSCYTNTSGLELFEVPQRNELSVAASLRLQNSRRLLSQERHTDALVLHTRGVEAFVAPKYVKINGRELIALMRSLRMWSGVLRRRLEREFYFQSSDEALRFVNSVHGLSLRLHHYPKIIMIKTRVMIQLRTTEVDGISNKDIELAKLIDTL